MTKYFSKMTIMIVGVIMILGGYLLHTFPDKNLFTISSLERDTMLKRDGYLRIGPIGQIYGRKFGKYYFNRYMIYSLKLFQKISLPLSPIRYFNSTKETNFSYLFLPLFIIGILFIINKYFFELLVYLLLSAFFTCLVAPDKTIILFYPLIIFSITSGIFKSLKYLNDKRI